jgi:hypothetical protein
MNLTVLFVQLVRLPKCAAVLVSMAKKNFVMMCVPFVVGTRYLLSHNQIENNTLARHVKEHPSVETDRGWW